MSNGQILMLLMLHDLYHWLFGLFAMILALDC